MKQILKRLELIKTSIDIEDEEIIMLQVEKLKTLEVDSEVLEILTLINSSDYAKVIEAIDAILLKHSGLVVYEDKELLGLKMELKSLESKLQNLSAKKREYLNIIDEFQTEYHQRVGYLIAEILRIKKDTLFEKLADDEIEHDEYKEAKDEYDKFYKEYESIKDEDRFELSQEQEKELKSSYKKASRLSHPDIVDDAFKKQAEEVFKELNAAYSKKDLNRVKEILDNLESGKGFEAGSQSINDKTILMQKIEKLKDSISQIDRETEELLSDETFKLINDIEDFDEFFENLKEELEEELEILEEQELEQI
jgi:predicted ArsR family transcriptional regulator